MIHHKKHTLPSIDMNGKVPIRSLLMTLVTLSANAPKQNALAMDSLLSASIIAGLFNVLYYGTGAGTGCGGALTSGGNTAGVVSLAVGRIVVLRIPFLGLFMCPLAVAGLGLRYLETSFSFMLGHPLRKPFFSAFMRVEILGLHNNWCANLTALVCVRMGCVNPAA